MVCVVSTQSFLFMFAYFRDLFAVISKGLATPYRSFFRWNVLKLFSVLYGAVFAFVLAFPGIILLAVCVVMIMNRVPQDALKTLAASSDAATVAGPALDIFNATGPFLWIGLLIALGWVTAGAAFSFSYTQQVLYRGSLLRAAQGEKFPMKPALAFSGLALRKYFGVIGWVSLWTGLILLGTTLISLFAEPIFAWVGWADPVALFTPFKLFNLVLFWAMSIWLTIRFGFAPLFLVSDLRASRSGWSYVAESFRFSSGRTGWRLMKIWLGCTLVIALFPIILAVALRYLGVWLVPLLALIFGAITALQGSEHSVRRWASSLGIAALFCLIFLVVVVLLQVLTFGLFGYLANAYFPSPVAAVAAFVFLGLEDAFLAALWHHERKRISAS